MYWLATQALVRMKTQMQIKRSDDLEMRAMFIWCHCVDPTKVDFTDTHTHTYLSQTHLTLVSTGEKDSSDSGHTRRKLEHISYMYRKYSAFYGGGCTPGQWPWCPPSTSYPPMEWGEGGCNITLLVTRSLF